MKIGNLSASPSNAKRFVPTPIPLARPASEDLKKNECLTLKLRTDPNDAASQTYELTVKFFRTGTAEEWLIFMRDLKRILVGQNVTTGPPKYAMIRRLILGDTLAVFNKAATEKGNETVANFEACLQEVTTHVFPQRALAHQKRYMRRYMRKPRDMSTREFTARVTELNAYLKEFPPFQEDQHLDDPEIMDILEFGVPNSWQKNMVMQGFDPMIHTTAEFVCFCERHEFTEGALDNSEDKNKVKPKASLKSSSNDGKSRAKPSVEAISYNKNKRKATSDKWCDLHQTHGHNTSECKVVQSQISKMRASWESVRPNNSASFKKPNSNYTKDSSVTNKKELMTMVKESIKSLVNNKKQKTKHTFHMEEEKPSEESNSDFEMEDFGKIIDIDNDE